MACTTKNRSDRDRQFRSLQHGFRILKHKTRENNLTPENAEPIVKELKTDLGNLLKEDGSKEPAQRIFDFELFDKEKHQSKLIQTINSLESELGELKGVEKEDKKYIDTLESQLKQKDRDMSDLKEKIKRLVSDHENIEKENKDHINSLLSQLSQRDGVISDLKDEEKRLEEKNTLLVEKNDSDRKRCEELEWELNTLKETISNLTKEITRKDETVDDLQKGNKGLIAKREELAAEIETMKSTEKGLEQEKKELQHHVEKMTDEIKRQAEEFARAYENLSADNAHLNRQINQLNRSLEEQRRTIDKLQKNLSEEKKAKENALNRLSAAAANRLRDQNPGITDLSDPNRPLKLAEKVSELYDNEWTNAMENLESELDIEEDKGIKILLKIIRNVFNACAEFGDSHLQSFPDMLILPASFIHTEKERMVNVKDLPSEMLKPMKDFRKSHAKHAINHLQKFFATEDGKSKLQIKKKVFKTCEDYINKCIELCWMMRIQDPPIYMETEYPTNSDFDSNKMRSYTKAGKFIHFVVWPTFFLHKDGPLLAKGVVQGSKIEIKDGEETNSDEECSSSSSDSDGDEFEEARSRTDSQPGDNPNKTTSQDEVRDIPKPNQLVNKEISQDGDEGDGASNDVTNDTPGGTTGANDIPEEQNNTDDKRDEPNNTDDKPEERNNIDNKPKETNNTDDKPEANNDTHINQSKPPGSEANDEKEAVNSDDTKGEDGGERAAEQKDDDETQSHGEVTDV